jgi:hypothetical protein
MWSLMRRLCLDEEDMKIEGGPGSLMSPGSSRSRKRKAAYAASTNEQTGSVAEISSMI